VYAAANRDFRMVLATDAISGATDVGLNELAQIGVYLMATEQLLDLVVTQPASCLIQEVRLQRPRHKTRGIARFRAADAPRNSRQRSKPSDPR
jgi:hypothetical protein